MNRIHLFLLVVITAALAACSNTPAPDPVPNAQRCTSLDESDCFSLVEEADTTVGNERPEVLLTVDLESGSQLQFIDVGDGYLGVVETADVGTSSQVAALVERYEATPLEVYTALVPEASDVPELLVSNHARLATERGLSATARNFRSELSTMGLDDPGYEDYACSVNSWNNDWRNAFIGKTDYYPSLYRYEHSQPNWGNFYPGSSANFTTYLGVCSRARFHTGGYWLDMMDFRVQRKVGSSWMTVYTRTLYGGNKDTFFSWHPSARYRGAVRGRNGDSYPRSFGIGAAYTKALPFTVGFAP
ncbi:MAG: hypothetical protein AAF267_22555 [Deinococcota bacterium]